MVCAEYDASKEIRTHDKLGAETHCAEHLCQKRKEITAIAKCILDLKHRCIYSQSVNVFISIATDTKS